MDIAIARQDIVDLKQVIRRETQDIDQSILNRPRHFPKTGIVVPTFEHMDFCDWHFEVSPSKAAPGGRSYVPLSCRYARHQLALDVVGEAPARPCEESRDLPIGLSLTRPLQCLRDAPSNAGFPPAGVRL